MRRALQPYKTKVMRGIPNASSTAVVAQAAASAESPAKSHQAVLQVMRFDPATNTKRIDSYQYVKKQDFMVLDLLTAIKAHQDPTLAFRASCCEGVCGSCAMNINGINSLACVTYATMHTIVGPLPNFPVVKDVVVDMKSFFSQYAYIRPFIRNPNLQRYHVDSIYGRYLSAAAALYGAPPAQQIAARGESQQEGYEKLMQQCIEVGDASKVLVLLNTLEEQGYNVTNEYARKSLQEALENIKN